MQCRWVMMNEWLITSGLITTWVSVYGVILVRIFPHSKWIQRDTSYSVQIQEHTDQNNSNYGHFLRSVRSFNFNVKFFTKIFLFSEFLHRFSLDREPYIVKNLWLHQIIFSENICFVNLFLFFDTVSAKECMLLSFFFQKTCRDEHNLCKYLHRASLFLKWLKAIT